MYSQRYVLRITLLLTSFTLSGLRAQLAPPPNDDFLNRTVLVGTNILIQGDNSNATTEPGEPAGRLETVWYAWTSPTNGLVRYWVNTTVPNFYPAMFIYRGDSLDTLVAAPTVLYGDVPVTTSDTLVIQVASSGGGSGPFTLALWIEEAPPTSPNDLFANCLDITALNYHFDGGLYGATNEPGEPLPSPDATDTLWWRFMPAENGALHVAAAATTNDFTPVITVYDGYNFSSMNPVSPLSGLNFPLVAGREYSVQLAAPPPPLGGFSLDTRFLSTSNDTFATCTRLDGTNVSFTANYATATLEPNEPTPLATNTTWASWTAPCTGRVRFGFGDPPPNQSPICSVISGPSLEALVPVRFVASDYRLFSFLAVQGTTYYFQICGPGDFYTFSLNVQPFAQCINDNFADARPLSFYPDPQSVQGATMELGEPLHMGPVLQKSLWWQFFASVNGGLTISSAASLIPDTLLALYSGDSVDTLTLLGKATNSLARQVVCGQTYYLACVVPADAVGDIAPSETFFARPDLSYPVPGNLLLEPSWEGTGIVDRKSWDWTGDMGGYVNEPGGADGSTWPDLGSGTLLWQDIPTVPGHQYQVKFAYQIGSPLSSCCGDALLDVLWDTNLIGAFDLPDAESGGWHWTNYTTFASNSTSRVSFHNLARNLDMDAFSVIDLDLPPAIVTQPASLTSLLGGTAEFGVGATGSSPLRYQWFFNGDPLASQTDKLLVLTALTTNQAGSYFVTVSNNFGALTSSPALLSVDAPTYPTIVWQPYGDEVSVGCYFSFNAAAVGILPLAYQWFFNGDPVTDATNSSLVFTNIQIPNGGLYQVRVTNTAGSVWSLTAALRVSTNYVGGGNIDFRNRFLCQSALLNAQVYDIDGATPLSGPAFLAQLYAGPSIQDLRPAGAPIPFLTGSSAGFFGPAITILPNVTPGSAAFAQARAWEAAKGDTYEEARALGGKFGKSDLLQVTAGGAPLVPGCLAGLKSFSLQAGLPQFTVGVIQLTQKLPGNLVVWSLIGQPGYRYLIEQAQSDFVWQPYLVLTNLTGTVTFTNSTSSNLTLYRARILD